MGPGGRGSSRPRPTTICLRVRADGRGALAAHRPLCTARSCSPRAGLLENAARHTLVERGGLGRRLSIPACGRSHHNPAPMPDCPARLDSKCAGGGLGRGRWCRGVERLRTFPAQVSLSNARTREVSCPNSRKALSPGPDHIGDALKNSNGQLNDQIYDWRNDPWRPQNAKTSRRKRENPYSAAANCLGDGRGRATDRGMSHEPRVFQSCSAPPGPAMMLGGIFARAAAWHAADCGRSHSAHPSP